MKNNIAIILLLPLVALIASSCGNNSETTATTEVKRLEPLTMVIGLDLSNRVVPAGTRERDMNSIMKAFENFEKRVQKSHYIKSSDKFVVTVLRQSSNSPEMLALAEELSIDLSAYKMGSKRKKMDEFKAALPGKLRQLYDMAGQQTCYSGADVWGYLDMQLPAYLDMAEDRVVLILLTDGYIEMDPATENARRGQQYNCLNQQVLTRLREGDAFKENSDVLLLPETLARRKDLDHRLRMLVIGFQPREGYHLEQQMLNAVWTTWLDKMGIRHQLISYDQPPVVVDKLLSKAIEKMG